MYSKEYKELKELLKKLKQQLEEDEVLQEYYYFIEPIGIKEKIYERYLSRVI